MSDFDDMYTDTVSLVKKNSGERTDGIKCSVQVQQTFIERSDILIETGDLLQRSMSNGGEKTYEVIDPGFYEKSSGMPAHYQISHKKLGLPEAQKAVQNISYNISGPNARINSNSIDNSSNQVIVNSQIVGKLKELRAEINEKTNGAERSEAIELVDAVEEQFLSLIHI